jgi:hypothetical protein
MNFPRDDLGYLKHSLFSLTLSLLVSGALLWLGEQYHADALKAEHSAQHQLIATRQKLNMTQDDLANIAAYANQYQTLLTQHIIGDELRLDWVEGLSHLRQQKPVIDFRYTIQPQTEWLPSPAFDTGDFQIHLSSVTFQFDLLHDAQLLNFLNAVERDLPGKFIVERCQIQRLTSIPEAITSAAARLSAECSGGWITLKHKNTP